MASDIDLSFGVWTAEDIELLEAQAASPPDRLDYSELFDED